MERLTGVIQPYAWGSLTAIPEFLGVEATGSRRRSSGSARIRSLHRCWTVSPWTRWSLRTPWGWLVGPPSKPLGHDFRSYSR